MHIEEILNFSEEVVHDKYLHFFFCLFKNVFYISMNLGVSAEGINSVLKNPELEGDFVPCMLLFTIMQGIL